jgi:sarcosine oxidase subunit beta
VNDVTNLDDLLVCRCEEVTKKEIREAIITGADSVSWVKRMTRAGMGTCQGRTCGRAVAQIVREELGLTPDKILADSSRPPLRPVSLALIAETYDPDTCRGAEGKYRFVSRSTKPATRTKEPLPEKSADVVIIGGGSTGASTAYFLAKSGVKVILLDKREVASEGGGRNMGGIRQLGRHPWEMEIALQSIRDYETLHKELEVDVEYRKMGYLWVALNQEEWELQQRAFARQINAGANLILLEKKELLRKFPALARFVVGGTYSPDDGQANPIKVTRGYARTASKYGAKLYADATVTGINVAGRTVVGVETDRGEISAPVVLIAAGPWSVGLAEMVGLNLPIRPVPNQFMVTEPIPPVIEPLVLTSVGVCVQGINGNMYVGNGNPPVEVQGFDESTNFSEMGRTAKNMLKVVPTLHLAKVIRTWAGILDHTPDDVPIMGAVPNIDGLYLACGFSGHGFAIAPQVGKLLSELILSGHTSISIKNFDYVRFEHPERMVKVEHFAHQITGHS